MDYPTPQQIRAARRAAGLSQTAAADVVMATRDAWAKWEGGQRQMHPAFWMLFNEIIAKRSAGQTTATPAARVQAYADTNGLPPI